ncbi:MAG: amidase family protein [Burkholderiaceae bacterium]|nr:amidase family protein [Burkholderiaceae bacterium]
MPFTRRDFIRTAALGVTSLPGAALPRGRGSSGEFSELDATELAALVRMRKVSASELLEDTIRRLEAVNPKLNAVITKTYERARGRAAAIGAAGSETGGAFAGVPWLLKDISECKGLPMTMGSRALRGVVSQVAVPFVAAAEAAGLNIVGITNVPEFGLSDNSGNLLYGATHNPWGVAYGAAGSSSGSAAAVAAGIVPMAHGNDGGGSLRCPASACGLFTVKVSRGRHLPAHTANLPYDIGQDGVLSRSVRDNARFLSIVEDRSAALPTLGFVAGPSGRKLKIGVLLDVGNGVALDPAVAHAMAETIKLCEDLGHVVAPVTLPFDYSPLIEAFWGVWRAGAALTVDGIAAAMALPVNESHFEPWTLGLRAHANSHPGGPMALLAAAGPVFEEASARMDVFLQQWDAVLSPVYQCPVNALGSRQVSADRTYAVIMDEFARQAPFTEMHNACGTPAMSVPLYWDANGLPIGSQFFARVGHEATLLELAYQLEQARPWARRRPPVFAS